MGLHGGLCVTMVCYEWSVETFPASFIGWHQIRHDKLMASYYDVIT